MARNRSRGRNNRRDTRLTQRATRNVELQQAPQTNALNQQLQQAQQDYLRSMQAAQGVYGGFQNTLEDLPRPQFGQVQNDFTRALGSIADLFGGGSAGAYMPESETAAGRDLGLAYGEAGTTGIANAAEREGMYRSSAAREGNLAERQAGDTAMQDYRDTLQNYNDQLSNIHAGDPAAISQEMERLRQQALEQKLAREKMQGDQAFSKFLQDYLGGAASGGHNHDHAPGTPPHDHHTPDLTTGGAPNDGRSPVGHTGPPAGGGHPGGGGAPNPGLGGDRGGVPTSQWSPPGNGPWDQRMHPLYDYTHGQLAKGYSDMQNTDRQRYLLSHIARYVNRHPDTATAYGNPTQHYNRSNASDLLRQFDERYYG